MENEKKDYKEERFEFTLYVNDNIICKRNFRIFNYIENSMNTLDFKETVDGIVNMINQDLQSKTRVYLWFHFNPEAPEADEELISPSIEPWECTFKIVITDNKREVLTRIWDGYAYPKAIRENVDLSNKYVKIKTKDGQVYTYDKENYFRINEGRLNFDLELLKAMINDKQDVLLQITKKICEACSVSRDEIKEKGRFDPRESSKYLSSYTVYDTYGNGSDDPNPRKYAYSLYLANRNVEKAWEKATAEKTKKYFKSLK